MERDKRFVKTNKKKTKDESSMNIARAIQQINNNAK